MRAFDLGAKYPYGLVKTGRSNAWAAGPSSLVSAPSRRRRRAQTAAAASIFVRVTGGSWCGKYTRAVRVPKRGARRTSHSIRFCPRSTNRGRIDEIEVVKKEINSRSVDFIPLSVTSGMYERIRSLRGRHTNNF